MRLCRSKHVVPSHIDVRVGGKMVYLPAGQQQQQQQQQEAEQQQQQQARQLAEVPANEIAQRGCRTADIQRTQFMQLRARLANHPNYIFCHLGCCEHLVEVSACTEYAGTVCILMGWRHDH
jgi:hypothetical protein